MDEDFNAFLAAALAEGERPISAGGSPLRVLFPPLTSPEFVAAAIAEGTMSISAGYRPGVEKNRDVYQEEEMTASVWAPGYNVLLLGDSPFVIYSLPVPSSQIEHQRRDSRGAVRDSGALVDSESTGEVPRYTPV